MQVPTSHRCHRATGYAIVLVSRADPAGIPSLLCTPCLAWFALWSGVIGGDWFPAEVEIGQ